MDNQVNNNKATESLKQHTDKVERILKVAVDNNLKVNAIFHGGKANIDADTKAMLDHKDLTIKQLCELIELQKAFIADLSLSNEGLVESFDAIKYLYDVERQQNDGSFNLN